MERLNKDIYLYLINFADDDTFINMLKTNKKYAKYLNNDEIFKKRLESRYPSLMHWKFDNQTYKNFYLKEMYYLSKLWEEFQIPYINYYSFLPSIFYMTNIGNPKNRIIQNAIITALNADDLNTIKKLTEKAVHEKLRIDFDYIVTKAIIKKDKHVLDYLFNNYRDQINTRNIFNSYMDPENTEYFNSYLFQINNP